MRGFLVALAVSALVFSTSQAAGSERPPPKRSVHSPVAIRTPSSHRAAMSRKPDVGRRSSALSDFRAEDLIPDICKGCSS
jgi:hypothetical protein